MSEGWPKDFLRGSTVYKRAIWINEYEEEEEGYACVVCGDFVPDGTLNAEYDTHEILHLAQVDRNLITWPWRIIDEENLPKDAGNHAYKVRWKK